MYLIPTRKLLLIWPTNSDTSYQRQWDISVFSGYPEDIYRSRTYNWTGGQKNGYPLLELNHRFMSTSDFEAYFLILPKPFS